MSGVAAVTNNSAIAPSAPDTPTGLTATASGTTTINLSWTAPVDNGGSVITGYKIEVSTDSGSTWTDQVANTASTTTTYEHTGLAASTALRYRVSAINSIGTGTSSDVVEATTGTPANNAPVVAIPIPDQTATEGALFSYAFPDTTFTDADSGDTLSYTATKGDGANLPTWLTFTPATRIFTGTPAATDVSVAVKVTATDTNNGTVSDYFNIEVRAAAILHCNPSDPYEVFCATLTVAFDAPDYGFVIGNYGSLSPDRFTYGVNHRIGALYYGGSQLYFTTQQNDDSFATGFKLILDSVEFSLDGTWDADKVEYVMNNHGLSWSVNDTVQVKLVRLIPFSEKGPELEALSRTEGWLQVTWGERVGATEVDATTKIQAYNVEWRPVIRNYEGHTYGRVDKSAREHHLYNLESGTEYEVRVCELSTIFTTKPDFVRGFCSRYSRIRMPGSGSARKNDIKVSIEFPPEGGATKTPKTLSTSDTVIRWRYRVTGIHNSSQFQSSTSGVAAGRVALQYRHETRKITVYGTATFGALAPSSRAWMTWASEWTGWYLTESAPAM